MPLSSVKLKEDDRLNCETTTAAGISAFLGKLWKMVEDTKTDDLICWGKSGNTFVIKNQMDFSKTILPNYYKHNNIASFIRQLNMYGFHKIISTASGTLDSSDNDEIEFTHPSFVRGHPYLLEQIKRKMNNPKENVTKCDNSDQFSESIKRILSDIRNLRGKQENLGSQLSSVKQENEILWKELSVLRQKHASQQNILNKLIRFLVSLAQPANRGIVKRRLVPLMLKDSASSSKWKQEPIIEDGDNVHTMKNRRESDSAGPTIHEIQSSELLDNVQIVETTIDSPEMIESDVISNASPIINKPKSNIPASIRPVPTALISSNQGKKKLQMVYVTPKEQLPTHYIISRPRTPEYLVPDSSLMELVHETMVDDDDEFITVVTSDGNDIVTDDLSTVLLAENSPEQITSNEKILKKRNFRRNAKKRNSAARKETNRQRRRISRQKSHNAKKQNVPTVQEENDKILTADQFLINIDPENTFVEPLVELHAPCCEKIQSTDKEVLNIVPNPNEHPNNSITVEDMINIAPTPRTVDTLNDVNDANILQTDSILSPNGDIRSSLEKSPKNVIFGANGDNSELFVENPSDSSHTEANKNVNDLLLKEINDCIDNAQNMKIACTENSSARACVDDISMQLDLMQSDINSLKELMHHEGLTVDVNALFGLFNEDPMNYTMPVENSVDFHKSEDDKITGNELISAPSMFDFSDLFSQNDFSQPNSPFITADNDYSNLNTPQIETDTDENKPMYTPPKKKVKSK